MYLDMLVLMETFGCLLRGFLGTVYSRGKTLSVNP